MSRVDPDRFGYHRRIGSKAREVGHPDSAQSVRTKQPTSALIVSLDRLSVDYSGPNQPVNLFNRLDLRPNHAHTIHNYPGIRG